MTPAVGWTEHDYYRASRLARRLGEQHLDQQQVQGVLDAADAGAVRCIEPADMSPLTATPRGGLDLTFDGDGANPSKEARRPRKGA